MIDRKILSIGYCMLRKSDYKVQQRKRDKSKEEEKLS